MAGLRYLVVLLFYSTVGFSLKTQTIDRYDRMCSKLGADPFFETKLVIEKLWRIFYIWNMRLGADIKCMDIVFKNATSKITQRFWNDMFEYLEDQPDWDAPALYATVGHPHHEMLLFTAQGPAGSFLAVPNLVRTGDPPPKSSVPLLKFQMKIVGQGKFLVLMDCRIGGSVLCAQPNRPPTHSEIIAATAPLNLGDGFDACSDSNKK